MTIKKKLRIGMEAPLVVFLAFVFVSYVQIRYMGRSLARVTAAEAPKSEAASKMEIAVAGIGFQLLGYLQDHNPARLEVIEGYRADFRENQIIYSRLAEATKDEQSARKIDKDCGEFRKILEELINIENYQAKKLEGLREDIKEMDTISNEQYKACIDAGGQGAFDKFKAVSEIRIKVDDIEESLGCYLKTGREQCESEIYRSQEAFSQLIDMDANTAAASEPWLEKLRDIHSQKKRLIKEIVALEKEKRIDMEEFVRVRDRLRSVLGANIAKAASSFEDARVKGLRAVSVSAVVSAVVVLVGLAVAMVSQAYTAYLITQPIAELRDAAVRISHGRYDKPVEIESDDELGQLADSIGKIAKELERVRALQNALDKEELERQETRMTL